MGPKSKTAEYLFKHVNHIGSDCLSWPYGRDGQGYARAKVKGFETRLAHRIMCELVNGPPPFEGAVTRHSCGMGHKGCVNPNHLKWGTVAENNADKELHGNKPVGEKCGVSVLNPEKVRIIRRSSASGETQRSIASSLMVSAGTVQAVLEGRTWAHVK